MRYSRRMGISPDLRMERAGQSRRQMRASFLAYFVGSCAFAIALGIGLALIIQWPN